MTEEHDTHKCLECQRFLFGNPVEILTFWCDIGYCCLNKECPRYLIIVQS